MHAKHPNLLLWGGYLFSSLALSISLYLCLV